MFLWKTERLHPHLPAILKVNNLFSIFLTLTRKVNYIKIFRGIKKRSLKYPVIQQLYKQGEI